MLEKHEIFEIKDSDKTFGDVIANAPKEISEEIRSKNVIILPSHNTTDEFYCGTLDTLDYLNDNGLSADVYAADDDYKELSLHGAEIWLGTLIIKYVVIPVFCSVIGAYVYEKLKGVSGDQISMKVYVEKKDGTTSAIDFRGKIEDFDKALKEIGKFHEEI